MLCLFYVLKKHGWKMEERCDGDEGLFLPFSKRERLQLAEMPLRKIQKKRRRTPQERRKG